MRSIVDIDTRTTSSSLRWALRHCAGAESRGIPARELLTSSFIEPADDLVGSGVSPNHFALLCINLILALEDEFQGSSAKTMPVGAVAMGVRVMLGEKTLGDGLRSLLRFFATVSPGYHSKLDVDGDQARLSLAIDGRSCPEHLPGEEILVAGLHMYMSWFCGRKIPLLRATTTSLDHPGLHSDDGVFIRCPTTLSNRVSIVFDRHCLAWPRRANDRDRPVSQSLRFAVDNVWSRPLRSASVVRGGAQSGRVRATLEAQPGVSLDEIARQLNVGTVTLWRQLRAEGTSFRQLRNDWLSQRVVHSLLESDITVEDLAEQLNFADARSLRFAVKNLTGLSPSEIRQKSAEVSRRDREDEALRQKIFELSARLDARG